MSIGTREFSTSGSQSAKANRYDHQVLSSSDVYSESKALVYDSNAKRSVLVGKEEANTPYELNAFIIRPKFGETNNATINDNNIIENAFYNEYYELIKWLHYVTSQDLMG